MDDLNSWFDSNYQSDSQRFIENNSPLKSLKDKIISADKIMKLLQTKTNESVFLKKRLLNLADSLKQKERSCQELRSQVNSLLKRADLNKKVKTDHQLTLAEKDLTIENLKHKISYIESENKIFRESSEAYLAEKSKLQEKVSQKTLSEKKHQLNLEKKDKRIKVLTQDCENFKGKLLELKQKVKSLQEEIKLNKQKSCSSTVQDTAIAVPYPNVPSKADDVTHIINEMTMWTLLSPIPSEHNEEDEENSFCELPDQNGCDNSSDDDFAEMLETKFLQAIGVDNEMDAMPETVKVPKNRNNPSNLLQSPKNKVHLQVKHSQIIKNGIDTAKTVCDKSSERGDDCINVEEGGMRKDLDDNFKPFEILPDGTLCMEKVLPINGQKLTPCSDNMNSGDILKSYSMEFHNVVYDYTQKISREISLEYEIDRSLSTSRKCPILSDENLKMSRDNWKRNINKESFIECQNGNGKNTPSIKCGQNSDYSKTNSKKILENNAEGNQTAGVLKPVTKTFHNVAYNYTEPTPSCEVSIEDEIDSNISALILSDGNLKKSEDNSKRNNNKESVIASQNENGKSKIKSDPKSVYSTTNSEIVCENYIKKDFSETADDFKSESVSAKIPTITKDSTAAADLNSTISETSQPNLPQNHQNGIDNSHPSQINPQTLNNGNLKDKTPIIENTSIEESHLHAALILSSPFNNSETKFSNSETKFNNSETKFSNSETKFNNSETKFSNSETKFNNSETKFSNSETKFNNLETKFSNSETKFNNSETKFNNSETKFNNSETKFCNSENISNNLEVKFDNFKKTRTTPDSLPKISETFISTKEVKDLDFRTSLVSNETAALKLQEQVSTENNNENSSSEEYNNFSDDSLELDYNTSRKVNFQRNLLKSGTDGEKISKVVKEQHPLKEEGISHWIKIEHSYALETENNEDNLTFSDSLSEHEIDLSSDKYYTSKPITSINDLFGGSSSDSENEKQFSNSNVPLTSVNNIDKIETCTNSNDQNSQIPPLKVKLKEFQSEEMKVPVYNKQPISRDPFKISPKLLKLLNFSNKTNIDDEKITAVKTAWRDIKENRKLSQESVCDRTYLVNTKSLSHFKGFEIFLQNSISTPNGIASENEPTERGKNNKCSETIFQNSILGSDVISKNITRENEKNNKFSETILQNSTSVLNGVFKNVTKENVTNNTVSSEGLGTEEAFDLSPGTEKPEKLMDEDFSQTKIFARDSNENVSTNDILILMEEFILVAPLITPFPDTLEFIKRYSSDRDTVKNDDAVSLSRILTKNSVEKTLLPHLPINGMKRPMENAILPNNNHLNKDHVNGHDREYPGEPVSKISKPTPVKAIRFSRNLSSNQNVHKNSTAFSVEKRLLNKTRFLNKPCHKLLNKRTSQLKVFKKEFQNTALQTPEKLVTQFESISDLKSRKAEEIKKCFVKAGESIEDNSVATSENCLLETSTVNKIYKSVSQKKHKRLNVDKKPEDGEQLSKRQCTENRVITERTRSASQKVVERELANYLKSTSSPASETVEKIFNSKYEPTLIINTLVLQIVKMLESSQYEMLQWYYINSNAGQPTPYLSEKESRLFHIINLLNDRSDINDFIPKLCDSVQKTVHNYGKELNQSGRWSLCRVYIALCRLQGQLCMARVFFYDTLCQLPSSHYMLFALTVSATWPLVLTYNKEAGHVTLPQVIEHVVVNSMKGKYADKKALRCLYKLCGWSLQTENKKNEVPRQLLAQLQGCLDATLSKDDIFCLMKGIELLSVQENWSWTNSLIRNRIGPLLKKYLSTEEPSESVTSVLYFILEMLGNLYLHGQTRDKTVCYAVNYLLKPLLASKKVPQQINLCCANVLLKLFPFDPGTIYPTLEIFLSENPTEITSSLAEKWSVIKQKISNTQNLTCPSEKTAG